MKKGKKGRRLQFGLNANKKLRKGKLWAADAFKMGTELLDFKGKKLRIVSPIYYERHDNGDVDAVFDFFARYDTVYVCLYKDIAITTIMAHDEGDE